MKIKWTISINHVTLPFVYNVRHLLTTCPAPAAFQPSPAVYHHHRAVLKSKNTLENACVSGVEEALTELLREGSLSLRDMMRMLPSVIVSCISQEVVEFVSGKQFTLEALEDAVA